MRLPPHYVARPRLSARCATAAVVVVEAAAGFGKSVLGAELAATWDAVPITLSLEHAIVPASLFIARFRAAVAAAGYTQAAAAALACGEDAVGAIDATLTALADESCAFVIDDAHELAPDGARLLDRIASGLVGDQRLVVLARALPVGAERLERAEHVHLDATDLTMSPTETVELCRRGFGLDVDPAAAQELCAATGGWTAATVLAVSRVARAGVEIGGVADGSGNPKGHADAVDRILAEALSSIDDDVADGLAQLARLPLLDEELVDRSTGVDGLFANALGRGIPLTPAVAPWWDLAPAVRERLAGLASVDVDVLRRAADAYVARGELLPALVLLVSVDEFDAAGLLLADASPAAIELMDVAELVSVLDRIPAADVDAHPGALLNAARRLRIAARFEASNQLIDRARALAIASGDEELRRALDAEGAHEFARLLQPDEAKRAARQVLAEVGPRELMTTARALQALGYALCWQLDGSGRRDEHALDEAVSCFERCTRLYGELAGASAAAAVMPYWAINVEFARGHARRALEMLDDALAAATAAPHRWAFIMCFRCWVAADLGLDDVCRDGTSEVLRVAGQLHLDVLYAQAHWKLAILASYRGDAERTLEHVRTVERHQVGWWTSGSGDFLAEAADLLDRVGLVAVAHEYLERAADEPKDAAHLVALSAAVLEARHGDPVRAAALLDDASRMRIDPREYWRVTLLRAFAAFRGGDHAAAGALAARSFEEAAAIDQSSAPLIKEAGVTEQLLGLALETGQPAAAALEAVSLPRQVTVLGRFELIVAGRPVPLGAGQELQLLKLLAIHRRLHVEASISSIWPDVDLEGGRNRLRTVLSRLRTAAGDVVAREGEVLVLDDGVTVDVESMLVEAGRARALAASDPGLAASVARGAVARYRGELLPDDRYTDWADGPREKARRTVLDLLALCADEASTRGDLDEVRRLIERAIEVDPYDDTLYLRAAEVLVEQGRRAEALSVLRRATSALDEIGIPAPPALDALALSLRS